MNSMATCKTIYIKLMLRSLSINETDFVLNCNYKIDKIIRIDIKIFDF